MIILCLLLVCNSANMVHHTIKKREIVEFIKHFNINNEIPDG